MIRTIVSASLFVVIFADCFVPRIVFAESEQELLKKDLARIIAKNLGISGTKCRPKTSDYLWALSNNITSDLAQASRKGTAVIFLTGVEGLQEKDMPLAVDNWLHEIRSRGGSVKRRVHKTTEASGVLLFSWALPKLVKSILSAINKSFDLAAREWLYHPAGFYDAIIEINRFEKSNSPQYQLKSIKLTCRN